MSGWPARRAVIVSSVLFVGSLAGAVVAVQASASGGGSSASGPTAPPLPPGMHVRKATVSPSTTATNAHCGQVLTASLTLNGDLACPGAALTITGTSVVLNLNGHTISGPGVGTYVGVLVSGKSDTVQNGVVTAFGYGISVSPLGGNTDTVSAVRAVDNVYDGIVENGTGVKITNCVASGNGGYGILASGVSTALSGDHELDNGFVLSSGSPGLLLGGYKQTVTSNVANGNGAVGIEDEGDGSTLKTNIANYNVQDGINARYDAAVIDGGGNTAKGNDYGTGQRPEQCYRVVCN